MVTSKTIVINKLKTPDWSSDFEIGLREVDLQHKNFLELIRKVEYKGKGHYNKITIEDIFQEIIYYSQYHFHSEENLMKEFSYPDIESHKAEHKILQDHILLEVNELTYHPENIVHLHNYLLKWLLDHVLMEDKRLGQYILGLSE